MRPTLLITGSGGFIGQNLVREMARRNVGRHRVVAVDRLDSDEPTVEASQVTFHTLELSSSQACLELISELRPVEVIHLAGATSKRDDSATAAALFDSNVVTTCNLLEVIQKLRKSGALPAPVHFILASSALVYGEQPAPFHELMQPLPQDRYSLSKFLAEQAVGAFERMGVVRACVLRPSVVYGPGQAGDMFIPALLAALRENRRFSMTRGEQTRDFVHISDLVEAILHANSHQLEGTYNVGSGAASRLVDVAQMVAAHALRQELLGVGDMPYRPAEVWDYSLDVSRLEATGWHASMELMKGLRSCLSESL